MLYVFKFIFPKIQIMQPDNSVKRNRGLGLRSRVSFKYSRQPFLACYLIELQAMIHIYMSYCNEWHRLHTNHTKWQYVSMHTLFKANIIKQLRFVLYNLLFISNTLNLKDQYKQCSPLKAHKFIQICIMPFVISYINTHQGVSNREYNDVIVTLEPFQVSIYIELYINQYDISTRN